MRIGSHLMDCDKIQTFAHTLPREHRNTEWQEDIDHFYREQKSARIITNVIGVAAVVLAILAAVVWVTV